MNNTIEINSNLKEFNIVDNTGRVFTTIYFNPTDTNIINRYEEVLRTLAEIKLKFKKRTVKTDTVKLLNEANAIVYEKVDYMLNAPVSEKIFSIMGPFSPLENGKFYVEVILKAIAQAIREENEERARQVEEKISKHTEKYINKK